MLACMDRAGNPSSVHAEGRAARGVVEAARRQVASLCGAPPGDIIFTSGATEAAAMVLRAPWRCIVLSRIEHPCVVEPVVASNARPIELAVGEDGRIDVDHAQRLLTRHARDLAGERGSSLLVVQAANNETGVVQPVAELAAMAREHGLSVLVDAVQAAGRIGLDRDALGADFMLLSSHKIGGPKGVGALVAREGQVLPPLLLGGGQERRRRAGTENVEGIAGFGAAAQAALETRDVEMERVGALRDELERRAQEMAPGTVVVGYGAPRLANTTCLALPGAKAETLVIKLDLAGVAVSAGAACSSGKVGQSSVLAAMGLEPEVAGAAIRVSMGHGTTHMDVESFLAAWRGAVDARLARAPRRREAAGAITATIETTIR